MDQSLHPAKMFTREYTTGGCGGNEKCVRVTRERASLVLHRLWDGLLTSSNNLPTLRDMATELRSKFPKAGLTELASAEPEAWVKEGFEIATRIDHQNGALRGTPTRTAQRMPGSQRRGDGETDSDRRMMLAGFRLIELLKVGLHG